MPYAHASELSKGFDIEVSPSEVDRISREVSGWCREKELKCVESSPPCDAVASAPPPAPLPNERDWSKDAVAVLSVDGAMVRSPESDEDGNIWYEVRRKFAYLWRHRHRMKYKSLTAAGLPVGSGVMETAVKQLCSHRLRQPGMMWSKPGAASMLCLRSAYLTGELDCTIERSREKLLLNALKYKKSVTRSVA